MDIRLWYKKEVEHARLDNKISRPPGSTQWNWTEGFHASETATIVLQAAGELQVPTKLFLDTRTSPGSNLESKLRKWWMKPPRTREKPSMKKRRLKSIEKELRGASESEI